MYKVLVVLIFSFASVLINYFLLHKKEKKLFKISVIIIVTINIIMYIFDCFIFKNALVDYIAFNMLLSFLLSITFEDIKTNLIDTRVILGYFILFLIYRIIFLNLEIFIEGLLGFALSLAILLIAYFIKRNSIGLGDIETIAACGMIIGFPNIFHFLFKAFLFVFIYGIFLILSKKNEEMKEIPLAPFLLIATIL